MKEELEQKLKKLQETRKKLEEKIYDENTSKEELEDLKYNINEVLEYILDIKRKLYFLKTPCKEGKVVDLREYGSSKTVKNYIICIHNTVESVGNISYRGYHVKKTLGDVGYEISEKYRGKNYAYHALCLLGELLKEQGVDDFWITTEKGNKASKKTIEKYGGICFDEEGNTLFYSCETRKLTEEVNKNDSKIVI